MVILSSSFPICISIKYSFKLIPAKTKNVDIVDVHFLITRFLKFRDTPMLIGSIVLGNNLIILSPPAIVVSSTISPISTKRRSSPSISKTQKSKGDVLNTTLSIKIFPIPFPLTLVAVTPLLVTLVSVVFPEMITSATRPSGKILSSKPVYALDLPLYFQTPVIT